MPGEEVGRLMAKDPDLGDNGHVNYRFVDGDGMAVFELSTDSETKEAIIKLKKVRNKTFVPQEDVFRRAMITTLLMHNGPFCNVKGVFVM